MATLKFSNIKKTYPNGTQVIHGINIDVQDGEFLVIVGPSGCGKSTLMRMVAGLESITEGEISIDGRIVNNLEPAERDIAMVFQNYALYPHMTVYDNMAYGLKIRRVPKAEIRTLVERAAGILELTGLLDRRPSQLSGGQRQRVAMGRAIVREPKVFLFDEPLSNLDAKLRVQMRLEIQRLHQRLRTTSLYVTHDQVEAMTLATRMVVMNKGIAEQIGTPSDVFERPASTFVASFIGSPPMNLLPVSVDRHGVVWDTMGQALHFQAIDVPSYTHGRELYLGLRPEHSKLHASGISLQVEMIEILGSEQLIHGVHKDHGLVVRCPMKATANYPIQVGETIQVGRDPDYALHWFDRATGLRIDA
ncbi:sn-glycerol-3-phosphate import ATP-binding protein UgpC [Alcaligenes endophyticus]|uniref:Sn-glycerol-3-phosphate import ATP-binding protein UgpC n=1 Tax=Alcaligenes endophyticus TaxID=1929088 RepID=A0ABT8EJM3_9BURK|nr:sn-glycerol-3-phosphate import ATP-binding protein UgpC [Alcaligenes endophyticus]MCX5591816.1 sn-glycerol-3-phosphate import ATP-binding protein UgpC [Alcaligenes endophyticus]MDN4121493.1 sn-glycerol-3-phosphate import ATP-binding protein UgpC [Alcaligenes endophyticus]